MAQRKADTSTLRVKICLVFGLKTKWKRSWLLLFPFVYSVVSETDLHKRLLFTMWNSDSTTRYLLVIVWLLIVLKECVFWGFWFSFKLTFNMFVSRKLRHVSERSPEASLLGQHQIPFYNWCSCILLCACLCVCVFLFYASFWIWQRECVTLASLPHQTSAETGSLLGMEDIWSNESHILCAMLSWGDRRKVSLCAANTK